MRPATRGDKVINWIDRYAVIPAGPERGRHVRPTREERETIKRIYDSRDVRREPVTGPLAAFLMLFHLCGPAAAQGWPRPELLTDIFTTWAAAGPDLRAVLKLQGERIVCPELGTEWTAA